jgi:hypothetical protein
LQRKLAQLGNSLNQLSQGAPGQLAVAQAGDHLIVQLRLTLE